MQILYNDYNACDNITEFNDVTKCTEIIYAHICYVPVMLL